MTLDQFNLLDDEQQAVLICKGVCIAGRDENGLKVLLFQLGCFYVEVYYHPSKRLIVKYKAIEHADKYLKEFDLALVEQ